MRCAAVRHSNIVVLRQKNLANCLTDLDRQDVLDSYSLARTEGFETLLIHVIEPEDGFDGRDYVAAYRAGEAWSTWGFVRNEGAILAWNAMTMKDSGTYESMAEALTCVLHRSKTQT